MLRKSLPALALFFCLSAALYGSFGTDTPEWEPLYKYIKLDEATVQNMRRLYARWKLDKMPAGWNKYLLGLIGDSVTNDGPFMSDIAKGSDGWVGKGIRNSPSPDLDRFYSEFVDRTIGGDSVLGKAAIQPGRSNPWLLDLQSHYEAKGNKSGAKIDVEGPLLLRNVLANRKPMWATIMFGQNHLGRQTFQQLRPWWDWLVDSLETEGVMPIILTLNPRNHPDIVAFNEGLRAYADSAHLPLVDWFGAAMDSSIGGCGLKDCTRDGVHPIRLGQKAPYDAGNFSPCAIFASECSGSIDTAPFALLNLLTLELLVELDYSVVDYVDQQPVPLLAESLSAPGAAAAGGLEQNRPNPFNPSTSITYQAPEGGASKILLEVLDVRGKRVRTLVGRPQAPGKYEVTWDGRDELGRPAPSGVYFYALSRAGTRQVRKMVLLK